MEEKQLSKAEKQALRAKRKRRLQIIRRIKVGAGLCLVLAVVLYLLCALVLFKVENVTVLPASSDSAQASNYYTDEEIVRVSGVETGDSLVLVSKKNIKQSVESILPYIGNVTIKRSYPSTLKIIVEDTSAFFAVENNGSYTFLNRDFKVVGFSEYIPDGCARLVGVDFEELIAGNAAVFEDESDKDRINNLVSECENAGIENITKYDLSNIANVRFVINFRITVIVGTITDMSDKLSLALKTIDAETQSNEDAHIIIDVTDPDRSYVRDDSTPVEENPTEPTSQAEQTTENNDGNDDGDGDDDSKEVVAVG